VLRIDHILVVSPMYKQLRVLIEKENLANQFRFLPEEELSEADLHCADALAAFNLKEAWDFSHVHWVHSLGAGVDKFLYGKDWPDNVLLTRTICSFGQRIAQYCLSHILKDLQFHDEFLANQRQKKWQPMTPKMLNEQKVMIYGTGEIGQATAKALSQFGVEVYGVSLRGKQKEYFKEVMSVDSHYSILNQVDYLINTMPLTERSAGFFDAKVFERLNGAGFINVGRGASVNEDALLAAMNRNQVRMVVLDVFASEPLPLDHPLWDHPKVVITPHISAVTTPEEGAACFLDTLRKMEAGLPLYNLVDINKGY
jgi:glyoxylate/hydroxypyruvate reductase